MSAAGPPSPKADFRARVSRYARLRAAQRALAAAAPLPTRFAAGSAARKALRELEANPLAQLEGTEAGGAPVEPSTDWVEGLATVDGLLARYAGELRIAADGIPGPQFRATLPPLLREDRAAVVGLLDLCVADKSEERKVWLHLIDYLVTLLAAEEGPDGIRRVANDPAQVAPRLRRLCAAKAKRGDSDALRLAEEIRIATDALGEGDDAGDVIQQVKAAKDAMGDSYFHPILLRAVTSYNLAASNQLRARADSERVQDQVFYGRVGFDESQDLDAAVDEVVPEVVPEPDAEVVPEADAEVVTEADAEPETEAEPEAGAVGSVFEAPGVQDLQQALEARLLRRSGPMGPAAELAGAMAVAELRAWERSAFSDPEAAAAGVVCTCVTVGLARRLGDEARENLDGLGLDPAALEAWCRELDETLQQAIQACLGEGDYERARNLQGTRGQWLSMAPALAALEETEPLDEPLSEPPLPSAPPAPVPEPRRRRRRAAKSARAESKPPRKKRRSKGNKSGTAQRLAAMGIIGAALALAIHVGLGGPKSQAGERRYVSVAELQRLSPDLLEGYTVERGGHKVFVAVVSPSWFQLSAEERESDAKSIGAKLGETGVGEVLLLDDSRRVEFHMVENSVRTLRR